MVIVIADGEQYGLFDYPTSLLIVAELERDFPGINVRVYEFES